MQGKDPIYDYTDRLEEAIDKVKIAGEYMRSLITSKAGYKEEVEYWDKAIADLNIVLRNKDIFLLG